MAHPEKCPVCLGEGVIIEILNGTLPCTIKKTCHGCNGKGWVEVSDAEQAQFYFPQTTDGKP